MINVLNSIHLVDGGEIIIESTVLDHFRAGILTF